MPIEYNITIEENSKPSDVQAVEDGLLAFNLQIVPDPKFQPLNIFVRDEDGRVLGGLLGGTYWGWLYVSIFRVCAMLSPAILILPASSAWSAQPSTSAGRPCGIHSSHFHSKILMIRICNRC